MDANYRHHQVENWTDARYWHRRTSHCLTIVHSECRQHYDCGTCANCWHGHDYYYWRGANSRPHVDDLKVGGHSVRTGYTSTVDGNSSLVTRDNDLSSVD